MIARIFMLLLAIAPMAPQAEAGLWEGITGFFSKPIPAQPPSLKVLVVHDQHGVVLEVKGKYQIYDPHTNEHISTRFIGKRKFIQALKDGLKWGEEFPGVHQLLIVPEDKNVTTTVDGIEYRGLVYIYDIGGAISVVNAVDIEDYLMSTLASKYPDQLPEEELAAVAIASRTYAYWLAQNPKNEFWAITAQQSGYQGHAVINVTGGIEKAIEATRYMVMSQQGTPEGTAATFPAVWNGKTADQGAVVAKISLDDAENMAKQGDHAAQILEKAFPDTSIVLMHYAPPEAPKVERAKPLKR